MAILWERTLTSIVVQKKRWKPLAEKAEQMLQEGIKAQEALGKSNEEAYRLALAKPLEFLSAHPVTKPESLGPFTLQQWQKGAYIHLSRNERFFARGKQIAGQELGPFVEGIIFKIYGNTDTAVLALKKGDIDYLWWGIESGYLEDLKGNPNIRMFSALKGGYRYMGFNLRKPPMSDLSFRHAVAFLVDKDFVIQRILHDQGCRLDTLIQPDNVQYCLRNPPKYGEDVSWKERVEKAKNILKQAGYSWEVEPVGGNFPGQFSVQGQGFRFPNGQPVSPLNLLTPPRGLRCSAGPDRQPNTAVDEGFWSAGSMAAHGLRSPQQEGGIRQGFRYVRLRMGGLWDRIRTTCVHSSTPKPMYRVVRTFAGTEIRSSTAWRNCRLKPWTWRKGGSWSYSSNSCLCGICPIYLFTCL